MKIAYFSPLNPVESGVSDYSEELLEYLAGYARIDIFIDDYRPTTEWLFDFFRIRHYSEIYENHGKNDHDIHVYHLGNNDIHSYIYSASTRFPGIVVLHDPLLHHFIFSQTVGRSRLDEYLRELDYCYGERRAAIVKATLEERDESAWFEYPLLHRVVDSSLGIVVHSEFARSKVLEVEPCARVEVIPHHYSPPFEDGLRPAWQIRNMIGFEPDDFVIGSMGYMNSSKRIDVILRVAARLISKGFKIKVLLVGKILPGCDVLSWVERLNLNGDVVITGFVDRKSFAEYLKVPDVFVAMRNPSAGETSGSVIKMIGSGRPVLISDNHAFSEFPDECCLKIPCNDSEESALEESLIRLIKDPEERFEFGKRAREYILANHDIQRSARRYIEFIRRTLKS